MKKLAKVALCASVGLCMSPLANAANWFDIQTISLPEWGSGKLIGFVQPLYTDYTGSNLAASNGQIPKQNLVQPTSNQTSELFMQRARLFLRGSINPDISYYVGMEAGQNAYDYSFGSYSPRLIDANVVFSNYIPGVRLEVGNIRAPGPEGAMEGFMTFNLLDMFPTGIAQLMQPTFYNPSVAYTKIASGINTGTPYAVPGANVSGNNGFRYPGVQAENWFMVTPNTEVAYGLMLADYGRLLDDGTSNGPIVAGRLQASYLLDHTSNRFFRNDLTGFIWAQQAHPSIMGVESTMKRDGFGMTYRNGYMEHGGLSVKAEYFEGSGNIVAPPVFDSFPGAAPQLINELVYIGSENKASGYSASAGYFLDKNWELVARYDYYDRLPNLADQERIFEDKAVMAVYHMTLLNKIVVDYIHRNVGIPNPGAIPAGPQRTLAQSVANSVGNQFDIWAVFAF
jgi:hypothetical protein